ncbi:MAG: NOG1 family protein [Promethearchaeota archaeon]
MNKDPFGEFKQIPALDDLLESAFNRARKESTIPKRRVSTLVSVRIKESKKIKIAYDHVIEHLSMIVKSIPNISSLPPFYRQLSEVIVGVDKLRQKIGRISGVVNVLEKLKLEHLKKIKKGESIQRVRRVRKEAFGRMKSVLFKLKSDFLYLREARNKLKKIPSINMDLPVVVVAGYPNVGKSSFINNMCGTSIKVAQYPFTTKEIKAGIHRSGFYHIQFIDTPGILDRPMHLRNAIEMQAITAIKYIADLIIFMVDATFSSSYPLEAQTSLLKEIEDTFSEIDIIILVNKIDLMPPELLAGIVKDLKRDWNDNIILQYSAKTHQGEDKVIETVQERIKGL